MQGKESMGKPWDAMGVKEKSTIIVATSSAY
jgi:hypothetical protein